jgi:hypothetical protein
MGVFCGIRPTIKGSFVELLQRPSRRWDELRRLSFGWLRTDSEQLTYLLFLKMAEKRMRGRRGFGQVVRWFSSGN